LQAAMNSNNLNDLAVSRKHPQAAAARRCRRQNKAPGAGVKNEGLRPRPIKDNSLGHSPTVLDFSMIKALESNVIK
jgi:hypothetical protein